MELLCFADANETALIVIDQTVVLGMSLDESQATVQLDLKEIYNASNVVAVTYDYLRRNFYWHDAGYNIIFTTSLTNDQLSVFSRGINNVRSMALDWVAGNIYWVDATFGQIEVANVTTGHRAILLHENITSPNQIVVDPRRKYASHVFLLLFLF